jgi:hypothetical protein
MRVNTYGQFPHLVADQHVLHQLRQVGLHHSCAYIKFLRVYVLARPLTWLLTSMY